VIVVGRLVPLRLLPATASTCSSTLLLACAVCVATLFSSGAAIADSSDDRPLEENYFNELPIVLSVTRLRQSQTDTPASVSVLDREFIRATGASDIPGLLRYVPGFQVAYILGTQATATAHGRADEYARDMQVTIDGRSIYDPVFGGVSWRDIKLNLDDIQQIEVVRGPSAPSHGSNAFAGVINITTRHPAQQQGLQVVSSVSTGRNHNQQIRYAGHIGRLDFRINASLSEADGFDTRSDDENTRTLSFRGVFPVDTRNSLEVQLGYGGGPREAGFVGSSARPSEEVYHINHYQQLEWRRQLSVGEELTLRAYHNYQKKDHHFEAEFPAPLGTLAAGYGFTSDRYDLELQHTLQYSDNFRLASGIGGRYERAESVWLFGNDEPSRRQLRTFSNAEWRPREDLVVNAGLMIEAYSGKRTLFSPRIGLNHHLDGSNTLRFSASRAYRLPTLLEDNANVLIYKKDGMVPVDYNFLTQEDLEPEDITAFEIGYLGRFASLNASLDIRLFHERIRNVIPRIKDLGILGPGFIPHPNAPGALSYVNDGEVDINGFEMNLKFRPQPESMIQLGYSLANARGEQLKLILADGTEQFMDLQGSVPQQTFSLLASHRFANGIELSGGFHYVDAMQWLGGGDSVPATKRLDLRLAKHFRLNGSEIDLELVARNVDGDDIEFYNSTDTVPSRINNAESSVMLRVSSSFY
jgi:iron complex outermembrane receptor protein